MYKKIFSLFVSLVLAAAFLPLNAWGAVDGFEAPENLYDGYSNAEQEQKTLCNATLEDDFADNVVLVVLFKKDSAALDLSKSSVRLKSFSPDDFVGIGCINVYELTIYTTNQLNEELATIKLSDIEKPEENLTAYDLGVDVRWGNRILKLELAEKSKEGVLNAIRELEKREDVLYAGPDFVYSIDSTVPNDQYYVSGNQWAIGNLDLPNAWDITTGSSGILVGVLDTGIQYNHPDLVNQLNNSLHGDFTTSPAITGITPSDLNGHGTHVAGIIGAQGNNGIGITGVCWNVGLVSLRAFDVFGGGYPSDIAAAVNYAAFVNIPILNLSGGGGLDDLALHTALSNYSGLFVCAAGNNSSDNDVTPYYPSNYRLGNLISVGALTIDNGVARMAQIGDYLWGTDGSNYGETTVDIFAPGTGILSTYPTTKCTQTNGVWNCRVVYNGTVCNEHHAVGYHEMSGTSMATPYVAGAAALILSKYPYLTAYQLKEAIMGGVDAVFALDIFCVSGGKLNAKKALDVAATMPSVRDISYLTVSGDFDGDGKDDVATFRVSPTTDCLEIVVWRSTGSGYLPMEVWFTAATPASWDVNAIRGRVTSGDYDGDGKDEIAAFYDYCNGDMKVFVFMKVPGNNSFVDSPWYSSTNYNWDPSRITGRVTSGDYNGDGKDEIAAFYNYGNGDTGIWVFSKGAGASFAEVRWERRII